MTVKELIQLLGQYDPNLPIAQAFGDYTDQWTTLAIQKAEVKTLTNGKKHLLLDLDSDQDSFEISK